MHPAAEVQLLGWCSNLSLFECAACAAVQDTARHHSMRHGVHAFEVVTQPPVERQVWHVGGIVLT
jgi:hypothetical protein